MSDDQDRQFVDANVLVYAHDRSAGEKHYRAGSIIATLWKSGKGCLSVQALQEFYVTITQKVARRLDQELASQIVADLAFWRIHAPGAVDILRAIEIQQTHKISFWDAMIIRSAQVMRCQILWTEGLQADQEIAGIRIVNPFAG